MNTNNNEFILSDGFPKDILSLECLKERKAGSGQTLTGMGKWWGRKPLILVRATILGILMPSSGEDEESIRRDREIFLKILTMDDKGLNLRRKGNVKDFEMLSYEDKLKHCVRPEEVKLIDKKEWDIINTHLKTNASSLEELIHQLGELKFGHTPKVGDCFAGGGSIPFESARIGCDAYASDLNPVACLLNWANLNILSKSDEEIKKLNDFRQKVYDEVDNQIIKWGIEENENSERAIAYLYCNETKCPECGHTVPLSPSWDISKKTNTVAILKENNNGFDIEVVEHASKEITDLSKNQVTIKKGKVICPHCDKETSVSAIRGDRKDLNKEMIYGLRKWESNDIISRKEDVFKERLYCIRYEGDKGVKRYVAPSKLDLDREEKVLRLLKERFEVWKEKGYIPSSKIEEGYNTSQILRERGWTYWHQLFNPRQLLINGLLAETCDKLAKTKEEKVLGMLGVNKCTDWNSKLSIWESNGSVKNTFMNQALNTVYNYGNRGFKLYNTIWNYNIYNYSFRNENVIEVGDARDVYKVLLKDARDIIDPIDVWITDPPYADAVNYDELSEFFLAWDKKRLKGIFPEWYTDSKRALAVRGKGKTFNESMIEVYSNLEKHTTENGIHVLMFAHSKQEVWDDLLKVIESSNLKLVKKIDISTETESGGLQKNQNRVRETSLLICRKNK